MRPVRYITLCQTAFIYQTITFIVQLPNYLHVLLIMLTYYLLKVIQGICSIQKSNTSICQIH